MKKPTRIMTGAAAIALCAVAAGANVLSDGKPAAEPAVRAWPAPKSFTTVAQRKTQGGDFNGDGRRDLAAGAGNVGVVVIYSGPQGPDFKRRQFLNPNNPGTPGLPVRSTIWGIDIASADFDHDDYDDLVVTDIDDDPDSSPGTLVIFYGSKYGLTDRTVSLKVGSAAPKWIQGGDLAIGDFGDNGKLDIVFVMDAKAVVFFRNVVDRPVDPEMTILTQKPQVDNGYPVIGDFTGDGYSDLALIRHPVSPSGPRGELRLGTAQGLSTTKTVFAEGWIEVYGAVAADVNGDGKDDLITSDWSASKPTRTFMGMSIMLGTAQGFGARLKFLSPCIQEIRSLAAGDVNGDGKADIAATCGAVDDPGRLAVMPGTTQGIDPARAAIFEQKTPGLPGRPTGSPDWFGDGVTIGDLTGDGKADVAIGSVPRTSDMGHLFMFPGSATGPILKSSMMISARQLGLNQSNSSGLGLRGNLLP